MKKEHENKKYQKIYEKEVVKLNRKFENLFKKDLPRSLYEPCSYIMKSGGKRLRPFLVLVSVKAVGGQFRDAYNAAMAVEILHNFTLVHDDIMDHADKRRGRQTLHVKYDTNTAILTGDILIALAYEFLNKDTINNPREIVSTFTKGIIDVCEGQGLDKEFETKKKVSIDEYKKMIYKKTAALSEMCCSVGAQIGGGKNEEIRALSNFGKNIGMAFQLTDDLLDIIGDEKEFGKSVGGDLVEGKKTYLFLKALEKAGGKERKELLKVIERNGIRKNQIGKYRNIYLKLGIIEDTKKEIDRYTKYALNAVKDLNDKDMQGLLYWLAELLTKRKK